MGMRASITAQICPRRARVPGDQLVGEEGQGSRIALAALDSGRLGIAACSTGLAQAALDDGGRAGPASAASSAGPSPSSRGCRSCSPTWPPRSRRPRAVPRRGQAEDAGLAVRPAAAMAKLFASDTAMRVTTDAVQVFGGYGYVQDFPVERYMREAKVLQIVEGTNQIQRMVIGRWLTRGRPVTAAQSPLPRPPLADHGRGLLGVRRLLGDGVGAGDRDPGPPRARSPSPRARWRPAWSRRSRSARDGPAPELPGPAAWPVRRSGGTRPPAPPRRAAGSPPHRAGARRCRSPRWYRCQS